MEFLDKMADDKSRKIAESLTSMNAISSQMRDIIFLKYFDNMGTNNKYVLSLASDCFQTVSAFCYCIQKVYLSQAGTLLRKLCEEVAMFKILVDEPESVDSYVLHYKVKVELKDIDENNHFLYVRQKFNLSKDYRPLKYLDYGWIPINDAKKLNENGLLEYAGFSKIIRWRKDYLNQLVHSSISSTSLIGENGDFPIIKNFMQICCFAFDHLCCSFHKFTDFNFDFGSGNMLFNSFRNIYKTLF